MHKRLYKSVNFSQFSKKHFSHQYDLAIIGGGPAGKKSQL